MSDELPSLHYNITVNGEVWYVKTTERYQGERCDYCAIYITKPMMATQYVSDRDGRELVSGSVMTTFNSALTRARYGVYIIGDYGTLMLKLGFRKYGESFVCKHADKDVYVSKLRVQQGKNVGAMMTMTQLFEQSAAKGKSTVEHRPQMGHYTAVGDSLRVNIDGKSVARADAFGSLLESPMTTGAGLSSAIKVHDWVGHAINEVPAFEGLLTRLELDAITEGFMSFLGTPFAVEGTLNVVSSSTFTHIFKVNSVLHREPTSVSYADVFEYGTCRPDHYMLTLSRQKWGVDHHPKNRGAMQESYKIGRAHV